MKLPLILLTILAIQIADGEKLVSKLACKSSEQK